MTLFHYLTLALLLDKPNMYRYEISYWYFSCHSNTMEIIKIFVSNMSSSTVIMLSHIIKSLIYINLITIQFEYFCFYFQLIIQRVKSFYSLLIMYVHNSEKFMKDIFKNSFYIAILQFNKTIYMKLSNPILFQSLHLLFNFENICFKKYNRFSLQNFFYWYWLTYILKWVKASMSV